MLTTRLNGSRPTQNTSIVIWVMLFIAISVLHIGSISAEVIVVASDNTGQANTIQAGINLAAVGDTVLISHGIWTGAVVIDNKPITIGSYFIIDGDSTHISQTIIDGEDTRTGIIIQNCSGAVDTLKVIGLTITNCRSNWYPDTSDYSVGGGIGIRSSDAKVIRCKIFHNRAYYGGGIGVYQASVYLYGNEIFSNSAITSGGGLSGRGYSNMYIYFDGYDLNSVFDNYASRGCDISYAYNNYPTSVILNKGSVSSLDPYFYFLPGQTTVNVLQPMITQIDHDLWVSPDGDNNNNGETPLSPLRNISYALAKIKPISGITRTVHVMPGTYSRSQTNEALPLQLKSDVNLYGSDMESVILDAEHYGSFICGKDAQSNLLIKNLSLINGYSTNDYLFWMEDVASGHTNNLTVDSIHIRDSWVKFDAFRIMSCHNLTVNNLIIEDSQVGNGFNIYAYETGNFSNFRVQRLSSTNYDMYNSSCTGGGIGKPLSAATLQTTINISNFLITDIVDTSQIWQNMPSGLSISVEGGNCDLNVSNCTIANNSSVTQSGGLNITLENCNIQVYNTVVSGNTPYEVAMAAFDESSFADVSFSNCMVTGGSDSLFLLSGDISHTWLEGNQSGVPLFRGGDDIHNPQYYSLSASSPCIDAGTPDTTGLSLLPYDLAGNMRIWNNVIDMGCFEFGAPPVGVDDPVVPQPSGAIFASNYPNPFNPETNISFFLPEAGNTELCIYNLKGQVVRRLMNSPLGAGTHRVLWDGKDESNSPVASGMYLFRVQCGKHQFSGKMVLAK